MHSIIRPSAGRSAGFSVIELLTVLVLIGVLASLSAPKMGGYIDANRTRRAADRVVVDISQARLLAVTEGSRTAVQISADGNYTLERLGPDGSWTTIRTVDLSDDYGSVMVMSGENRLEFNSRGVLTNQTTNSTIEIGRNNARAMAFVSPAGRVYRDY